MITSTANQQIKNLIKLCQKTRERKKQKLFVAEGEKMFTETPKELLEKIYVSESYYNKNKHVFDNFSAEYEIVQDTVFKAVSDTVTPQGVLCVARQPEYDFQTLLGAENPLFLLLEDIQDPGNLGTIFRTAEGAGVTAIFMSQGTVDLYNPKAIRSTMGSVYRVPHLYVQDLAEIVECLKKKGILVYAAHLQNSVDYDKRSYKQGTAFLIGNEGNGLSDFVSRSATGYIKIPMQGQLESLNAAVAASLLVYEAYRQRR